MNPKDLVSLGRIAGVFGIKGWVKIISETEPRENLFNYGSLWLDGVEGRPIRFDRWQNQGKGMVAHIDGVDDREVAKNFVGRELLVEKNRLAKLPQDEYYWHELQGLAVFSSQGKSPVRLGRVSHLIETGSNDVLVVIPDESSLDKLERLIPWLPDQFIQSVDLEKGEILVDWDPQF